MAGGDGGSLFGPSSGGRRKRRPRWVGRAMIFEQWPNAPQWVRYIVLTSGMFGIQLVWSCEMAQASPYLLSLGLSKSMLSIVFLAGPLSGLIVQPIVGILSDSCQSKLGRRRPFIIGGCVATATAVLLLGWAPEVAGWVSVRGSGFHTQFTIILAIIAVYIIDFSINVVQAMDRALLVDVIPSHFQAQANAWVSRVVGVGAVLGYWIGGVDLVWLTGGWLGSKQLKVLTVLTSVWLCLCHVVLVVTVKERVLIEWEEEEDEGGAASGKEGIMKALLGIWETLKTLPRPIQQILNVQFASWIGWFPILFFSTTWVAENYARSTTGSGDLSLASPETVDIATRLGTRSMLYHALVSLFTSIFLPPLISSETNEEGLMSLPMIWVVSNGFFAVLLFATWLASGVTSSSIIVALAGFCWAVSNWAPFSLLGDLIHRVTSSPTTRIDESSPIALAPIEPWRPPPLSPIPEGEGEESTPVLRSYRDRDSIDATSAAAGTTNSHLDPNDDKRDYPENNGSSSSLLLSTDVFGDPYDPVDPIEAAKTPRILQIRHSDEFDDDESRSRVGMGRNSRDKNGRLEVPIITVGEEGRRWEEEEEDEGDESGRDRTDDELLNELGGEEGSNEGGDQAGVILGCHNMYVVLPQFVVTATSSIIFAIFAPGRSVHSTHPSSSASSPLQNATDLAISSASTLLSTSASALEGALDDGDPVVVGEERWDALGMIFRLGGVSVAVSCLISWKMAREWSKRQRGIV